MSKEFLKTWKKIDRDPLLRKAYCEAKLMQDVAELIRDILKERKVSRKQLAERLGCSKSAVSQLLAGDRNMRLSTVADILFGLDCELFLRVRPASTLESKASARGEAEYTLHDWTSIRNTGSQEGAQTRPWTLVA